MNSNFSNHKPCGFPSNCYIVGPTGPTGPRGADGGATGPTEPTGPRGEDGLSPVFSIGSVETGNPGTSAQVTITEE